MPIQALNSSGSGSYSAIANAITYAADHGAHIINLSLGGSTNSSTLHNAVTYARNKGVFLAAAAGNNGTTALNYPAAYSETLSVAGTTSTDKLYSWSSYGSWVNVAAPGCDYATSMSGGYNSSFCGTSAATPVVSGMIGLLKSAQPSASVAALMQAVEATATGIGSVVQYGRVDAAAALTALGSAPAPAPAPTAGTATETFSGTLNNKTPSRSYAVTVGSGTLAANATFSRATDLTLQLLDGAGTVVAEHSGGSPVTTSASVAAGTYTVVVTGASRASYTLTVTYATP
jgi:hypothetical protein